MSGFIAGHIARLRLATVDALTPTDVAKFITTNTFIAGDNYSFKDHEYQERIVSTDAQEVVIQKCSQIGISETSLRMAMALCCLNNKYTVIYTFPTAAFASNYAKTRFDSVINESPYLRNASRGGEIDNAEVKQFGNSYLYVRGCSSANQAISIPCDHLIHDEFDMSDQLTASQYQSRLTHSPFKRKTKLSTPTIPNGPINSAFKASKRWYNFVKCNHCSHQFVPNYYEDVRIGKLTLDVKSINKHNLHNYDYKSAHVVCPHCGKAPSLQIEHREWVCENPSENFLAVGYQVSPFDAPNIITPGYLVEASTQYARRTDFVNVNLGLPSEDAESGITPEDVSKVIIQMDRSPFSTHVMGADMGLLCRVFIAGVSQAGEIIIVHTENVPIQDFRVRYAQLCKEYRVTAKVLDAQPYVETLLNLQQTDANLFAAYFVTKRGLATYETVSREENLKEGKAGLRQVSVNKNVVLDVLLDEVREGKILLRSSADDKLITEQLTSMKRIKQMSADGGAYVWTKPANGDDHSHFALLYVWLAVQIRGAVSRGGFLPMVMSSFKLKDHNPSPIARIGTGMG